MCLASKTIINKWKTHTLHLRISYHWPSKTLNFKLKLLCLFTKEKDLNVTDFQIYTHKPRPLLSFPLHRKDKKENVIFTHPIPPII